jgi:hypothetical protein
VAKEIDRSRPRFKETCLYTQYLQCLGVLLERTEPDAPALLRSEAWKAKTCQTALASWAQTRHTWALQGKQGARYVSESIVAPGFVEPVPEFYSRFAELVEDTCEALEKAGALSPADWKEMKNEMAADIEAALKIIEKARKDKKEFSSLSEEEQTLLIQFDPQLNDLGKRENSEKALSEAAHVLQVYQMRLGDTEEDFFDFRYFSGFDTTGLAPRWNALARLCHRLETLAHKQLRQVPFNDKEKTFFENYGKELARIMLYSGNSYFTPRDDAPRVVDVFSNPQKGKHLLVGTARPRELWVLYPTRGGDVLCRGAVLPYHEFAHSQRLTDAAWKSLLDSRDRPEVPAWIKPLMADDGTARRTKEK